MPRPPLAARVMEVIADRGEGLHPRYRYGSGCLVSGRTVLTAAHVLAGTARVAVRGPDKVMREATLDPRFIGDSDGPGPDLALVEIIGPGMDLPAMGLAVVDRNSPTGDPVERCHAIGYPAFMERDARDAGRIRDTVDASGHLPVLSGLARGLLTVQVSSTPRELPPEQVALEYSEWSGMSGGPLIVDGKLLGVVTEHAPRAGPSAITVTPLTALQFDPEHPEWGPGVMDPGAWWARLGVSGMDSLPRLPTRRQRAMPAYWATVQAIHQRTEVLIGRHEELAEIISFASGTEGYRWLVGDAWAGKTSLLAEAVTAALPAEIDVVSYFLSRREGDADSAGFLAAAVEQLAYFLEEDPPAAQLHQFRAQWQRAAERAVEKDRHVLLVVDGLDEDLRPPGLPSVAAVLPLGTGSRMHVLVSSRPYPELPGDMPLRHPLGHAKVEVQPFEGAQERAELARQEILDLIRDGRLAADVLGLLTAAAGPLTVEDLATMTEMAPQSAALRRQIRRIVILEAARSLQPVGTADGGRYQFAHASLLEYAQTHDDLNDPEFRHRIHQWAQTWRAAGWPLPVAGEGGTPRYLLDTYPSTLTREPQHLAALASDAGWVATAIQTVGADRVLADLRRAAATAPTHPQVAATLAAVALQTQYLQPSRPLSQPGYVLRQLCLQAAELKADRLFNDLRARMQHQPGPGLAPLWTTRRTSRALAGQLSRAGAEILAVAALPDGRVVSGDDDGSVLVWDPATAGTGPEELGDHQRPVVAVAVLADRRVVSGGDDGRLLTWDPATPGLGPVEIGRHDRVRAVAALPDGRVVSGGDDKRVLLWDPGTPGADPSELGSHDVPLSVWSVDGRLFEGVSAVAVLPDGRVVSGGHDGRVVTGDDDGLVLVWDPAIPGASRGELGRHDDAVRGVTVLPDGRVVSGGEDGRVLLWDPAIPGPGPAKQLGHEGEVRAVAVLPDGRVVTGYDDGRVRLWNPATPRGRPVKLGRGEPGLTALVVLPDARVVNGSYNHKILMWDPATPGTKGVKLGQISEGVLALAVLPDGRVVSGGGKRVLIWDPATPGAAPVELGRVEFGLTALAVLPDARVVSGHGRVLLWDPATPGAAPVELGRVESWLTALAVLPDARVVSGGEDGRVLLWDPATPGAAPVELGHHDRPVRAVAALPDGRVVTGGDDDRALVWDVRTRNEIAQLGCSVSALATGPLGPAESSLIVAHKGTGFSLWSVTLASPG